MPAPGGGEEEEEEVVEEERKRRKRKNRTMEIVCCGRGLIRWCCDNKLVYSCLSVLWKMIIWWGGSSTRSPTGCVRGGQTGRLVDRPEGRGCH